VNWSVVGDDSWLVVNWSVVGDDSWLVVNWFGLVVNVRGCGFVVVTIYWSVRGFVAVDINVFSSDFWFSLGHVSDWFSVMGFSDSDCVLSDNLRMLNTASVMFWLVSDDFSVMFWLVSDDFSVMFWLVSDDFTVNNWLVSDDFTVMNWSLVMNNNFLVWVGLHNISMSFISGVLLSHVLVVEMIANSRVVWQMAGQNIMSSWSSAFVFFQKKSDDFTQNMVFA